jgi:transposase
MARRMPLMPIDSNRIRNQELSPWLRGSIQTWAAVSLGKAEIARKTFLTPATVQSTLRRNQRHEGITLPRSGRPHKLSARDRRTLLRLVRKYPKLTYDQVISETGLGVSKKTVYRILKEEGIKK